MSFLSICAVTRTIRRSSAAGGGAIKLLILLGIEDADIAADPAEQTIQYQQRLNELAAEGKSIFLWLDNAKR